MENMEKLAEAIKRDDRASIRKAAKECGDIKECEIEEKSVLSFAIYKNISLDNFILLIELGADLESKTNEGVNLLDDAISLGRLDIVKYLLDTGVFDVNKPTRKSGFTPLMLAASFSYFDIVDYLLEKGADIEARDSFGLNCIDYTKKLGQTAMKEYLEKRLKERK
jgi:ankyrin repeat protein